MKTCIAVADQDQYSETFIRDHINHLPCETVPLYREWPWSEVNGRSLAPFAFRGLARFFPMMVPARDAFFSSFLKKAGISVVLAEYATTAVPLIAPCRRAGIPLVAHFHGFDAYNQEILKQYREGYRLLFKEAAAIIAGSHAMEEQLLKIGARRETLFYNPGGGVHISQYERAQISDDRPLFVAIGRFVDKKAPHLTILAFAEVLREFPQAELAMIGEGPLLEACKQMTSALGLESSIHFLGKQDRSSAAEVLRNARACVQHSVTTTYGDSEGTAISNLEA